MNKPICQIPSISISTNLILGKEHVGTKKLDASLGDLNKDGIEEKLSFLIHALN